MTYYEEKLNQIKSDPLQLEAYLSKESTVVIAGPGSGKTTVLTLKVLKLLNEEIKEPRGLACLTYSKEAAREFQDRIELLGHKKRKNVFMGTVHAFCISEIIENFHHLYDYKIPYPIRIISKKEKTKLFKDIIYDLNITDTDFTMVDMDKERLLSITGLSEVETPSYDIALAVAKEYEERLYKSSYVDYESIIKFSTLLIQENEYVREVLEAKFPWFVIDEYQDLGKPLHEMVLALFKSTNIKIFVVGDPDQSIYSFTGAIPNYLMELYNRKDVKPIQFQNNYRSTQGIIDSCELILNEERNYIASSRYGETEKFIFIKCELDMDSQYDCVVNKIIPEYKKKEIHLDEIAILVGKNDHIKQLSHKLLEKDIPFYVSKHDFDRSDLIKWLEDCAKWVLTRQISFEDIYIFYERLLKSYKKESIYTLGDKISYKSKLYQVLLDSENFKDNLREFILHILNSLEFKTILNTNSMYPDEIDNIKTFIKTLGEPEYINYDISKFSKLGKPENQIVLSTRHSSKGLEFEIVIMLGMEEGNFPFYRKVNIPHLLEEENRVCFVCVSRAKKTCIFLMSEEIYITPTFCKTFSPSRYWVDLNKKYNNAYSYRNDTLSKI